MKSKKDILMVRIQREVRIHDSFSTILAVLFAVNIVIVVVEIGYWMEISSLGFVLALISLTNVVVLGFILKEFRLRPKESDEALFGLVQNGELDFLKKEKLPVYLDLRTLEPYSKIEDLEGKM